ncbi:MAG: HEAT repeat domain-containing protein [Elusimicrobia bacterium]|nr:HEAT repeat domain-containing protein [Elusimicrobiota bacterium]
MKIIRQKLNKGFIKISGRIFVIILMGISFAVNTASARKDSRLDKFEKGNTEERRRAARAMRNRPTDEGLPELIKAARSDSDSMIRSTAIRALGNHKSPETVSALKDCLSDEEPVMRMLAIKSLARIADPGSVPAIVNALGDGDEGVRLQAVKALGNMGDAGAIGELKKLLGSKDPMVRSVAAGSLGRLGDTSGLDAAVRGAKDKRADVRRESIFALRDIKEKNAGVLDLLYGALKDEDGLVRGAAEIVLKYMGEDTGN